VVLPACLTSLVCCAVLCRAVSQVRFVVMANIFVTDLQIHRRYDIKGSTEGRTVGADARSK
jgi:1-phosphatidylinositol-4-phosphate 5-kinase